MIQDLNQNNIDLLQLKTDSNFSPKNSISLENQIYTKNNFNVLNKKRLETKGQSTDKFFNLNKLQILNSSATEAILNNSNSTMHTLNNNNNNTNLISTINTNKNSNLNNLTISGGNPITKFSPLPKPDFSGIEKSENCLSYISKNSYKKPKKNYPDSLIKKPRKFASTPGNAIRYGKKTVKKSACRKLNFFMNNDQETDELNCINKNYDFQIEKNDIHKSSILAKTNSKSYSDINFNLDNIKYACSEFKSDFTELKSPFFNLTNKTNIFFDQSPLLNEDLKCYDEETSENHLFLNNTKNQNETNKKIKNTKKRVFFCDNETSQFELNDPVNNISKMNLIRAPENWKGIEIHTGNEFESPLQREKRNLNLNTNLKENFLRNKYPENNSNYQMENEDEKNNKESDIEIDIDVSEFDLNKNLSNYEMQNRLSLNESRKSNEFISKCEDDYYSNLRAYEILCKNPKNYINTCDNKNNNGLFENFFNNVSVREFKLEPSLENSSINKINIMPTNYEKETYDKLNNLHKDERNNNLTGYEFSSNNDKNFNFFSKYSFNYDSIMEDISDFSKKSSETTISKFESEFKIIGTLDSGSFGVVYKCQSITDNKIFAIKKTKKLVGKGESNIIKDLINDLNIMGNFNCLSKNIVKYMESWREEGLLYIKQEYCKYGDLLDFLQSLEKKNFQFDIDFYWDIFFEMICGLKYLHESGYLHLDIKPQNFLVGDDGTIKLGDFNLSRKKNCQEEDYFEGDSIYLAPEILEISKLKQLNEKCDIFSLGLSMLEILCKIKLPQNGFLWNSIRTNYFLIPEEFFKNSNLNQVSANMINMLQEMIAFDPFKRKELDYLIQNYPELKTRYEKLSLNEYTKTYTNYIIREDIEHELEDKMIAKRSNSYKFSFSSFH